jgi:osmotically-inducible protein OsmY
MMEETLLTDERALPAGGMAQPSSGMACNGRLAEAAVSRLRKSGYSGLWSISCEAQGSVLVLRGRVDSYYCKQLAQELVRRIDGAEVIVNRVDVCPQ